ncbi:TauD/TfdA family dioxygenase [Caldovatus aquaticus]|uniref:TauD/TfdA family dioxygenase n=1 Tax=Caldovatus aquaticus TaxID=2865671 RepID=A0ABS7F1U1_9PROT|nr:TauD/TfdA family dioxygenase [Caldovatus aquaticus]MBW8268776.1 TauD/TfdA family dioxygenase [Caldovatus aquaticus]
MSSSLGTSGARLRLVPQAGPALWGADGLSPSDWMIPLGQEAGEELEAALAALLGRRPERATDVPLPTLAPLIADLRARLEHGRGFALLRGLPFDRHGAAGAETLLLALGLHLGTVLPEDLAAAGGPVSHLASVPEKGAAAAPFHADPCDAVLLLCLRQPPASGASALISAMAVHNALLRRDRAALETLYRPLPHRAADGTVALRPVFALAGGAFSARYDRLAIEAAVAAGASPLEAGQSAALEALDAACADPALAVRLETRPGDLLCFNPQLVWKRGLSAAGRAGEATERTREFLRLRLLTENSRTAAAAQTPPPAAWQG